jgi:nucleotidyltransferase/DNA polymerase involved in DNA repair
MNSDESRALGDLEGIGPAMLEDLRILGVQHVAELAAEEPAEMYERLQAITGQPHDICVLDVFTCAVAQARDPELPEEECKWWTWSRRRKGSAR